MNSHFERTFGLELVEFIDASPTPFHAVEEVKQRLEAHGFTELLEDERWKALKPGMKHFVIRGGTSLIAFIVGKAEAFRIIGAHTDSPTLRIKPNAVYDKDGYLMLGVEPYGGGIWRTWLDRDLGIAGHVVAKLPDGKIEMHLVRLEHLVVSVNSLAIHLDHEVNQKGAIDKQVDLPAILSLGLPGGGGGFRNLLLGAASLSTGATVLGATLSLYDLQKGVLAGMDQEFIRSGRLDDLASCHQALMALVDVEDPQFTAVAVFWDHEEVGSGSSQGASGTFLSDVLERICLKRGLDRDGYHAAIAGSFCLSVDLSHAVHPNHPDLHEKNHAPMIGGGPVLKYNASQRYATNDYTAAVFTGLCYAAGVNCQTFVNRSDLSSGSTIGPITAAGLGVRTVDVGIPILGMHSIREESGIADHLAMEKVCALFYTATDRF